MIGWPVEVSKLEKSPVCMAARGTVVVVVLGELCKVSSKDNMKNSLFLPSNLGRKTGPSTSNPGLFTCAFDLCVPVRLLENELAARA